MKKFIEETINNWEETPKDKLYGEIQNVEEKIKNIEKILNDIDIMGIPDGTSLEELESEHQKLIKTHEDLNEKLKNLDS